MQIDYFIGHKIFTLAKANVRYRDVGNRDIFFFFTLEFYGNGAKMYIFRKNSLTNVV